MYYSEEDILKEYIKLVEKIKKDREAMKTLNICKCSECIHWYVPNDMEDQWSAEGGQMGKCREYGGNWQEGEFCSRSDDKF